MRRKIKDIENSVPTPNQWQELRTANFTSADQHSWDGKKKVVPSQQKEMSNEEGELGLFYQTYAGLKKCHEVRKGYAAVHVNSVEMANYKSKAKSIENGIFNKYPEVKPKK